MKRKSNWLKNLLQWGTLAAIVGFVVYGLTLGEKPADVEAYCRSADCRHWEATWSTTHWHARCP